MGLIETKTFLNGDHVAIDLPTEFGLAPDERFTIEKLGPGFKIMPVQDPVEEKRKLMRMIAALRAIGPVGEIEKREPFEFPDRPGL